MSEQQHSAGHFQIEKIYVKDLSLEIPNAPQVFLQPAQPQLEVQIDTSAAPFAEGYFEATVSATVTAKAVTRRCSWPRRCRPAFSRCATCRPTTSSRCSASPARRSCFPICARRSRIS